MGLIWFLIGAIGIGALWGMMAWGKKKRIKFSWFSWIGILLTLALSLFTTAWCLSSIGEKEYQAAGVGLLIFGTLSLVSMGLTRRVIQHTLRKGEKR